MNRQEAHAFYMEVIGGSDNFVSFVGRRAVTLQSFEFAKFEDALRALPCNYVVIDDHILDWGAGIRVLKAVE